MGSDTVEPLTIEVGGAPVFYLRAAGIGTAALYLHSIPTSADDWSAFLALTGGLAPDLLGFGRSGKSGHQDYSLSGYVAFLERFLDAVEVDQIALVGHGWGAAIGLAFAQRHPARIERLVIIDALPLLDGWRWPRMVGYWRRPGVGELVMGSISRRRLARTLRSGSVVPDAWPSSRLDAVWAQFDQGTQRAILRLHRSIDGDGLAAAGGALDEVECPGLVVWGERDPWIDASFADAYAVRLPGATVHHVASAGHWPWLDQPAVISRVAAFIGGPAPGAEA